MGRAIVRQPSLLLMDEPMSNLDAKLRTELRSQIALLCRRLGTTTLYVTHDQVEAMSLGDRVAVMRRGQIVQCSTPDEIYENPVDVFVAGFIGSPPMNLLAGVVIETDERRAVRIGSHVVPLGAEWDGLAVGRQVVCGCRPESLRPDPRGPLTVAVEYTEHLGPEALIYCSIDASSVSATGRGHAVGSSGVSTIVMRSGLSLPTDLWRPLRLSVEQVHLFDLVSGRRIPPKVTNPAGLASPRVVRC
jgi:multiple sugar transport system ATP-binding protein